MMIFDKDMAQKICDAHAGGKPLCTITEPMHMPSRADVYQWLATIPEFRSQMKQASAMFCHGMLDDVVAIADIEPRERQMRINARLSVAGKYMDYLYGDTADIQDLTDEQIDKIIAEFLARFDTDRTAKIVDSNGREKSQGEN